MSRTIIESNKLRGAYMLGYMMLGELFDDTLAKVQMERELTELGYTEFDKLREIGLRKHVSSAK